MNEEFELLWADLVEVVRAQVSALWAPGPTAEQSCPSMVEGRGLFWPGELCSPHVRLQIAVCSGAGVPGQSPKWCVHVLARCLIATFAHARGGPIGLRSLGS